MKQAKDFLKVGDKLVYCIVSASLEEKSSITQNYNKGFTVSAEEKEIRYVQGGPWKKEHPQNIGCASGCDIVLGHNSHSTKNFFNLGDTIDTSTFKRTFTHYDRASFLFLCTPETKEQAIQEHKEVMKKALSEISQGLREQAKKIDTIENMF